MPCSRGAHCASVNLSQPNIGFNGYGGVSGSPRPAKYHTNVGVGDGLARPVDIIKQMFDVTPDYKYVGVPWNLMDVSHINVTPVYTCGVGLITARTSNARPYIRITGVHQIHGRPRRVAPTVFKATLSACEEAR